MLEFYDHEITVEEYMDLYNHFLQDYKENNDINGVTVDQLINAFINDFVKNPERYPPKYNKNMLFTFLKYYTQDEEIAKKWKK